MNFYANLHGKVEYIPNTLAEWLSRWSHPPIRRIGNYPLDVELAPLGDRRRLASAQAEGPVLMPSQALLAIHQRRAASLGCQVSVQLLRRLDSI